jgi:hypothetical protein
MSDEYPVQRFQPQFRTKTRLYSDSMPSMQAQTLQTSQHPIGSSGHNRRAVHFLTDNQREISKYQHEDKPLYMLQSLYIYLQTNFRT